eukprot:gene9018-10576_t
MTDTVGLDECEGGKVNPVTACRSLIGLLKNSKEGYHVIIMVVRIGSILASTVNNNKLFVNKLADNKIPLLVVVTGCELEDPMQDWVTNNRVHFEKAGVQPKAMIASTFAKATRKHNFDPEIKETVGAIRSFLTSHVSSNPEPIKIYNSEDTINTVMTRIWNKFAKMLKLHALQIVNKAVYDLLGRLGLPMIEAKSISADFI